VLCGNCTGEVLLGDLARAGFKITEEHEDADAIVVNTCAFVEDAKAESLEVQMTWRGRTSAHSSLCLHNPGFARTAAHTLWCQKMRV
jgi:tRNA A37 methylthiotransferase MiaB